MNTYALAAVAFRVCGVLFLLQAIYYLIHYVATLVSVHTAMADAAALDTLIRVLVIAVVLYLGAPLLAKVAAWKI